MLAAAENALIARLADHRDIKRLVRTVASLPKLVDKELLARYLVDAPALYIVPGKFTVADSVATLRFTLAGVVRNVAGNAQARKGDGIDLGCDQLATLVVRALHGQVAGPCTWYVTGGEQVDETVFDAAGIAAVELQLESTPLSWPPTTAPTSWASWPTSPICMPMWTSPRRPARWSTPSGCKPRPTRAQPNLTPWWT